MNICEVPELLYFTDGVGFGESLGDGGGFWRGGRVAPTVRADSVSDIVDDIVIAGGADPAGHVVKLKGVTDFPGDVVVGTGAVAADADGAEEFAFLIVQG